MPKTKTNTTANTSAEPLDLKEACIRAAHEFIAEHGVERLSLRDVARRLGVSHQAPYKHYPSRDHLLAQVIQRCFSDFASYLDARGPHSDPHDDLTELGQRYLEYAAKHPLEYRLMFATPWPDTAQEVGLVAGAVHAFDVLRRVLRLIHGTQKSAQRQVDLDAMFIWSNMHGLASISHSDVMPHLGLAPKVAGDTAPHVMQMMSLAMDAQAQLATPPSKRTKR